MTGKEPAKTPRKPAAKKKVTTPVQMHEAPGHTGQILARAREARGLTIEDVSAAIHIRAALLRAIEAGDLAALPGITYALGFVKNYGNFLQLDGPALAAEFKEEHAGEEAARNELHYPEPLAQDRLPTAVMAGVASLCAIVILVVWTVFSGNEAVKPQVADTIPPAPAAAVDLAENPFQPMADSAPQMAAAPAEVLAPEVAEAVASPQPVTEPQPSAAPVSAVMPETLIVAAAPEAPPPARPWAMPQGAAMPVPSLQQGTTTVDQPPAIPAAEEGETVIVAPAVSVPRPVPPPPIDEVINVRSGKGRIVLRAAQTSWVQISDRANNTVFKKVMRPGDQFVVPDAPGMTLVTSNAGGLEVFVDGAKVQALGRSGEILRGVDMNPAELKQRKIRVRD